MANKRSFLDGCHRYGWIITLVGIIGSIVINAVLIAYSSGKIEQSLADVRERVGRLEQQWDTYLHEVRGVK